MNLLLSLVFIAQAAVGSLPPGQPQAPVGSAPEAVATSMAAVDAGAGAQAVMPAAEQTPQNSMWTTVIFFGVMILVFWLLIIRPQSKQRKTHETFLAGLKPGDKIVTGAGLIGRIVTIENNVVTLEIAQGVRINLVKSQVVSTFKDDAKV